MKGSEKSQTGCVLRRKIIELLESLSRWRCGPGFYSWPCVIFSAHVNVCFLLTAILCRWCAIVFVILSPRSYQAIIFDVFRLVLISHSHYIMFDVIKSKLLLFGRNSDALFDGGCGPIVSSINRSLASIMDNRLFTQIIYLDGFTWILSIFIKVSIFIIQEILGVSAAT